jgi:hypothetical protein
MSFEVIWFDQDLVEIIVRCSNGYFAGTAEIYVSREQLSELADALHGFPSSVSDIRNIELGTFNPDHADGGLKMRVYCTNFSGNAGADIKLRGDRCKELGEVESVALRMRIEPSAIDSFVQQLKAMNATIGATAFLALAI